MEFDNFESVWQRVTALDETLPEPPPPPENKHEQKLCVIKRGEKKAAPCASSPDIERSAR